MNVSVKDKLNDTFCPFLHNVEKRSSILQKYCSVNITRFLKYIRPFFNIIHESVRYTNADLKISLYVRMHKNIMP